MRKDVPLKELHFGHEADPPINARKTGRESGIEGLAASIDAHGLGQALNVREIKGKIYVADGNRRLAALRHLEKQGNFTGETLVKCDFDTKEGVGGKEMSLALNFVRERMHEADEYEQFQELHVVEKLTAGQIGARFGVEEKRVAKFLALGSLAKPILEAWRNGELGDRPWEIVQAFTLAPSVKDQEAVFKRLKKADQLSGHQVRTAFGANNGAARRHLTFVGVEAYKAAGGRLVDDLFGDNQVISDPAIAAKLADEKIATTIADLKSDGWSWVEWADNLPYSWSYSWTKLSKKKASAEDKAKSGCVLRFNHAGELEVTYGVMKPAAAKAAKKAASKKSGEPEAPSTIPNAVAQRLSVTMGRAVRQAINANPQTALAAVLAGLGSSSYGQPIMVKAEGNVRHGSTEHDGFGGLFARYRTMSLDELLAALAAEAGNMVHFHTNYANQPILDSKSHSDLVEALEHPALQAALGQEFDAADYFTSVPRSFTEAAIALAINADEARKAGKLKKGELVKFALENVPKTGWLPPELRTSTYAGPKPAKVEEKPKKTVKKAE